jgi:hypothetical protein
VLIKVLLGHAIQSVVQGLLVASFVPTARHFFGVSLGIPASGRVLAETAKEYEQKDCQGQDKERKCVVRVGSATQAQLLLIRIDKLDFAILVADGTIGPFNRRARTFASQYYGTWIVRVHNHR